MKKYLAIAVFAGLIYMGQAAAQQAINYSFIELGYVESEYGDANIDGDGYEFNLSFGFTQTVAVVIGYQDIEDDFAEVSLTNFGIAYHKPYSNTGDMIFGLAYLESEVNTASGASVEETGNEISLEVRSRTSVQNEVHLGLVRREIDGESNSGYLFRIVNGNPRGFQFVIDYEDLEDSKGLTLGLRSSF